jgi:hypothetical protein
VVALAAGACAPDDDVSKDTFRADLLERSKDDDGKRTLTEDQAACLTDGIFEDYDQAEINRIYRAATEDELGSERRDELDKINKGCLPEADSPADEGSTDDSTTTTTDAGSEDETTTTEG